MAAGFKQGLLSFASPTANSLPLSQIPRTYLAPTPFAGCTRPLGTCKLLQGTKQAFTELRMQHQLACPAYVGQEVPLAAEYHDRDFEWAGHANEVAHIVDAQWAAAVASGRATSQPSSTSPHPLATNGCSNSSETGSRSKDGLTDSDSNSRISSRVLIADPSTTTATAIGREEATSRNTASTAAVAAEAAAIVAVGMPATSSSSRDATETASSSNNSQQESADLNDWERFYRAHPRARFFKERR